MPAKARFIDPMLLLRTERLPSDATRWSYELKLDGYRAVAFKTAERVHLRSRNDKDFTNRYPAIVKALAGLPAETVIDGEVVALDEEGRPSFNLLQTHGTSKGSLAYFVFDVMMLEGRDVTHEPAAVRRTLLEQRILPTLTEPVRYAAPFDAPLSTLIASVKTYGFEGLVAKRLDSRYEPGQRSGAWQKMRVNQGQEFVIGGFTVGARPFDALIFGYYEGRHLYYVARTRNGFTAATRALVADRMRGLEVADCPFANLPEEKSGRWGQGLTQAKMADCHWLRPTLVAQVEFLEWTADNHLRHSRFMGLRDDKKARDVRRETSQAADDDS